MKDSIELKNKKIKNKKIKFDISSLHYSLRFKNFFFFFFFLYFTYFHSTSIQ